MNVFMHQKPENINETEKMSKWLFVLIELSLISVIIGVGLFLIGYYAQYEYLATGYQDWIYHAFRVRDVAQYGIASWDHIWGNGINHWRAFQYVEHVLTYWVTQLTGASITHAMLWISVAVFISLRVFIYLALRYLGINRLFSLFVVIVSYAFSQQWIALKDYSIFVGLFVLPFYTLFWIAALKERRYIYILAAVTGALWSVHPVVGYSASGMLFLLFFANNVKQDFWRLIRAVGVFLISSLPFSLPYLFSGYSISNPIFSTRQFLQDTILSDYFGLSLLYFILLGASWCIMFWKSNESPRWAKLLLFYCTAYLSFIYFGQLGYYPSFINKFQFSRAIPFIALLLSFCFAAFLQVAFGSIRSRMITTVFLILIVVGIAQSIEIASLYSAQPTSTIKDPVALYFADKDLPQGSVYFRNGVESSYLGKPGLRFITSYNQHLLPNPYPMRFDSLMKTDISYTGVTEHQIQLINDYATALGVEYLFIPRLSPLVDGLTLNHETTKSVFEKVGEVDTDSDVYAVLQNPQPIAYAYAFEKSDTDNFLHFSELQKPTLRAISYEPWDEEISHMAALIRDEKLKPLPLSFVWPNKLVVDTAQLTSFQHPNVLIAQSYDSRWVADDGMDGIKIEPTNLRFMDLVLPDRTRSGEISLQNNWPWWHWPVQSVGIVMVVLTALGSVIDSFRKKKSHSITQQTV
jgi:hypothetical protein